MSLELITAEIPDMDGCPALARTKAFVFDVGMTPTFEHVIRDDSGTPINLSAYFPTNESESVSDTGTIKVRTKEMISPASGCNPVAEIEGTVEDAAGGIIRFNSDSKMFPKPGIYQISIAIMVGTRVIKGDSAVAIVQRSLFPADMTDLQEDLGPPTIKEIRNRLIDSGPADNTLLQDVEFTPDQLAHAICAPVEHWNESPPPIRPAMDTRTFPFREHWMVGICGQLLMSAAHNYRRNRLAYSAGGISVDDKNKEKEYLQAADYLWQEYKAWVLQKKYTINLSLFGGAVGSPYGGYFY